jgi:hypothetical protein
MSLGSVVGGTEMKRCDGWGIRCNVDFVIVEILFNHGR